MKTIEKSMTKNDFDNFVKFNNLEVFSQNQVLVYTASLMPLIQKAQKNELNEEEKKNLEDANFEINNFNTIKVVEEVDGRIIKSLFYVREKQVEELIEKSENRESSKFVFLDTELNRKFGRVGESFEKSCGKMDITKSEEFQTYSTFKKKGISDPKGELKKAHPNVDDAKADEIEKSFEDMISRKKEGKKEGEEKDVELDLESDKEVEKSIELDIIKGKAAVIGEIREWSGKRYKKQGNGKWVEVSEHGMNKEQHSEKINELASKKGAEIGYNYHFKQASKLSDKEFTDEELMGEKEGRNKNSQITNVLDKLKLSDNKYKDINKISVESTPKGNWRVYYDNKDTGVTLQGNILSDSTVMDYGMEYHDMDEEKSIPNEIEKSMDSMLNKITENFEKGLFTEDIYDSAAEQLEHLFEKSLMDRAKLRKQMITDKNGHRSSRWVRVNKDEGKGKDSKEEETDEKEGTSLEKKEESGRNKNAQILNVIDKLKAVNSKYKDVEKISVESTPKGNWRIYYDGKDTGTTLVSDILSDETVEKYGLEYHENSED